MTSGPPQAVKLSSLAAPSFDHFGLLRDVLCITCSIVTGYASGWTLIKMVCENYPDAAGETDPPCVDRRVQAGKLDRRTLFRCDRGNSITGERKNRGVSKRVRTSPRAGPVRPATTQTVPRGARKAGFLRASRGPDVLNSSTLRKNRQQSAFHWLLRDNSSRVAQTRARTPPVAP